MDVQQISFSQILANILHTAGDQDSAGGKNLTLLTSM